MNRLQVVWCETPDEDAETVEERDRYICFRVTDDWFSVDSDQLILPIVLLERNGETFDEPVPAILKQYGGESMLNDMLLSDVELEKGSEWMISTQQGYGRDVEPLPSND